MSLPWKRGRRRKKKRWRRKWRPVDPIDRLIDWQVRSLAGVWGDSLPGKHCGEQDAVQSRFCDVLDEKYGPIADDLMKRIFGLAKEGHTNPEIAEIVGYSTYLVKKILTQTAQLLRQRRKGPDSIF